MLVEHITRNYENGTITYQSGAYSVEIHNMSKEQCPNKPGHFRIDRATALGNPYHISQSCTREQSIKAYESYFIDIMYNCKGSTTPTGDESPFIKAYREIRMYFEEHGFVDLYCWCAPRHCHGEIIAKHLIEHTVDKFPIKSADLDQ